MPAHRADSLFERSVKSILMSEYTDVELIIVADGNVPLPLFGNANIIPLDQVYGPAHARNIGAQHASGEVLYFTDADVEIQRDTLTKVAQFFADAENVAMIGSYDDAPDHQSYVSKFKNLSHHFVHQTADEITNTFWGACGAVRKAVFEEVGGFDAQKYNRPCIEDIELGYRITAKGYLIKIVKDIQVKHLKKWTLYSFLKTDLVDRAIPWTHLLAEYKNLTHTNLNLSRKNKISAAFTCLFYGSLFSPALLLLSLGFLGVFSYVNLNLIVFFKRYGWLFTIVSVFLLTLHYCVAVMGFVWAKIFGIRSLGIKY